MDSESRFKTSIGFIDLLFNLIVGFAFLFIIAFLLIKPEQKKADFERKAEFVIVMEWDHDQPDDIDLYVQDPTQNKDMLEYIIKSINESEIDKRPFSHIFISGFFEKNFYINLLKSLPNKKEYIPLNKTGLVSENYPAERFTIDITPETLSRFHGLQNNVFNNIYKAFLSNEFLL